MGFMSFSKSLTSCPWSSSPFTPLGEQAVDGASPLSPAYGFYAPDHKMSGSLCHGLHTMYASVSVNIWFPSIIGQTPGLIDPIFLLLIEGD
jgi:hypothetical protein